jgi:hypothetical protein
VCVIHAPVSEEAFNAGKLGSDYSGDFALQRDGFSSTIHSRGHKGTAGDSASPAEASTAFRSANFCPGIENRAITGEGRFEPGRHRWIRVLGHKGGAA